MCLVPLCTFARLRTYNLTKTNQSQARVHKCAVGNTFSRRYVFFYLRNENCHLPFLIGRDYLKDNLHFASKKNTSCRSSYCSGNNGFYKNM